MTASACLRILLDLSEEKLARLDALGPLVARVTDAFLESRWSWPKQHLALTPFSVMLTDPKASAVDVSRLEQLAEELQLKLFGTQGAGNVTLLLFDGNESDTAQFAQIDQSRLKAAILDPGANSPFNGKLLTIAATDNKSAGYRWQILTRVPVDAPYDNPTPLLETVFRGVYFAPRDAFIGSGVSTRIKADEPPYSLFDSAKLLPHGRESEFDLACLREAQRQLETDPFAGTMFVPVCYSSLVRKSYREVYQEQFRMLPSRFKPNLAAAVYDVPRSPTFQAYTQLKQVLTDTFSIIDLQIDDPGFEVDSVPPESVHSVTYRLPEGSERERLAALRRFMSNSSAFRRRRMWPAITNIRTKVELESCLDAKAPFLTGAAICGLMNAPIGGLPYERSRLPLTKVMPLP